MVGRVSAPQFGVSLGIERLGLARRVEGLGFDSVWTGGHIIFHGPTSEVLTSAAALAAVTTRVRVGTAVIILPLYPPVIVAKAVSMIDRACHGRFTFGVGVGGEYPREFEACGVPVRQRGPRTDEAIPLLRRLWRERDVTHHGRFFHVDQATLEPPCVQPGGPPIVVAGRSEAAQRRAATLGDGYMPYLFTPAQYAAAIERMRTWRGEAGLSMDGFETLHLLFICVGDTYDEAARAADEELSRRYNQPFTRLVPRYCAVGTPEQCKARINEYVAAGVQHLILGEVGPPGQAEAQIEAIGREILPLYRGA